MTKLSTVQTQFLAKHLKIVPRETKEAIEEFKRLYPDVAVTPCRADPTLLRIEGTPHPDVADSIQGGLDIHPKTLRGLAPERQKKLMEGLHSSDPKVRAATINDFQKTDNERWRFDDTYQKTISELEKVPADLDALQPLLDTASPGEKNRMAQIQISHRQPEEAARNTRGVELALQMGATNLHEVTAYVEFFHAILKPEILRIDEEIETQEKPKSTPKREKKKMKADALLELMGKDTLKPELFTKAKVQIDAYKLAMAPYCGAPYSNAALDGASDGGVKTLLETNSDQLFFTDQANGGYHLLKHFEEMYDKLHAGDFDKQALHYATKAREAIASSSKWSTSNGQTGSTTHLFTKEHTAYVPVSGQRATLASYF